LHKLHHQQACDAACIIAALDWTTLDMVVLSEGNGFFPEHSQSHDQQCEQ
jgi:hypothetical protein